MTCAAQAECLLSYVCSGWLRKNTRRSITTVIITIPTVTILMVNRSIASTAKLAKPKHGVQIPDRNRRRHCRLWVHLPTGPGLLHSTLIPHGWYWDIDWGLHKVSQKEGFKSLVYFIPRIQPPWIKPNTSPGLTLLQISSLWIQTLPWNFAIAFAWFSAPGSRYSGPLSFQILRIISPWLSFHFCDFGTSCAFPGWNEPLGFFFPNIGFLSPNLDNLILSRVSGERFFPLCQRPAPSVPPQVWLYPPCDSWEQRVVIQNFSRLSNSLIEKSPWRNMVISNANSPYFRMALAKCVLAPDLASEQCPIHLSVGLWMVCPT